VNGIMLIGSFGFPLDSTTYSIVYFLREKMI